MIKKIFLVLDEEVHRELWNQKEERAIFVGKNISWEEFFVKAFNKKLEGGKKT